MLCVVPSGRGGVGHSLRPTLKAFLESIDGTLPFTSVDDFKICYSFDLKQTFSSKAISDLLIQPPIANLLTWTPDGSYCLTLLDEQRAYLEDSASHMFAKSIASAAAAGVTDTEKLAQYWVLRVEFPHWQKLT